MPKGVPLAGPKQTKARRGDSRRCAKCQEWKGFTEFRPRADRIGDLDSYCRPCRRADKRERHTAKRVRLALEHGQSDLCPICQINPPTHLDHDHATGEYRGWLCARCNQGLGFFRDSPEVLAAAIGYLMRGDPTREVRSDRVVTLGADSLSVLDSPNPSKLQCGD